MITSRCDQAAFSTTESSIENRAHTTRDCYISITLLLRYSLRMRFSWWGRLVVARATKY
jgi:hypothetical protein